MKKILVAINDDYTKELYAELFQVAGFEILKTKSGKESLDFVKQEKPDILLLDIELAEVNGFKVLEEVRKSEASRKTLVIIYAKIEKSKKERAKAMELEANDFISSAQVTPAEVVRRVKIILGEQRSYRISINKNAQNAKELITDLGYTYEFKCKKCGTDLILYLIRDLSKGENYFILSVICPRCY